MTATVAEELLATLLDQVGNFALRLDPLSAARLGALEGKHVRFEVIPPGDGSPRPFTLDVANGRLRWRALAIDGPNAIVRGTLPDIAQLLTGPDRKSTRGMASEKAGSVRIDGDEGVLREFADLLKQLEPDLAEPMSSVLGRPLADDLLGLAEAGIAFLKSAAEGIAATARDNTRSNFVDTRDFTALLDRLDDLRLRVDRVSARVALVETRQATD